MVEDKEKRKVVFWLKTISISNLSQNAIFTSNAQKTKWVEPAGLIANNIVQITVTFIFAILKFLKCGHDIY